MNIIDSHKEYLNDISRIASPDYRPSTQDVLIARVRTTQVVMEKYRIDNIDFEMYDVGGQRSERRKMRDIVTGCGVGQLRNRMIHRLMSNVAQINGNHIGGFSGL